MLLAGLATPLVLSVHTIVSFDFAVSVIPGWHTTIFPPYFVAGAIFSGFAMVLTLAVPSRKLFKELATRHCESEYHRKTREDRTCDEVGWEDCGVPPRDHRDREVKRYDRVYREYKRCRETCEEHVSALIVLKL